MATVRDNPAKDKQVYSIKELNRFIKMLLEGNNRLQDVWVRGEISNFTHHSSGHMYFTLKDADSRLKSIMFASYNQRLPFIPKEGTKVLACGNISVYERDGQYQFYVTQMQPDGIGSLYLAFEQLKKKLEAEGLFDPQRKKALPKYPRSIGVITSPTGAAVRDIMITLQRRFPNVPVLLYPVLVQGKGAAPSIVKAIKEMNARAEADVLIVGRGGGSLEELWAFNEEIVARAIAASRIPVISAVGHETDFTIADFAADLRAATPTAAAELAVPHHLELKQQVGYLRQGLQAGLNKQLERSREKLRRLQRSPYLTDPRRQLLLHPAQRLDRLREQLAFKAGARVTRAQERLIRTERRLASFNPREQVIYSRRRLDTAERQLRQAMQAELKKKTQELVSAMRQLDALSPLKVMQRGYGLVYDEREQELVKSVRQVQIGDILKLRLSDGRIDCHVWSMEEKPDDNAGSDA
ncbi:exodeoxyribonuclease VII large subunit [Paenibacillus mucilaginosus]|uniref:Exodeoxyribonuclease 7 large subunit n=2 Tax=Paenibacillus mucilaginosus TaxID=61624 RepID=H6NL84_9BACL|nr:exodeoxyribonuclease VII large subunit [Paenibacillus mucilaginosus]AEI41239.1 exodeoxyribonuclease VII large subunit [Paenibacillus mucilaginosus KNP414]AFC29791.1 exodeoxyribonuclease VII large subunit [Paenibacillus mucilaginosus 3016]MCG7211338.1 exodeoxyribonuclease VII large subunit [Paenibacillus mucilaginosus]WDM30277.1 exodeoxyribonuclease VII large subunit [Paenibacillus mucilaginosus]WFA18459.1 exodeoxyribonuclease VII large subunit [Paenibacillus mucilaginosus]